MTLLRERHVALVFAAVALCACGSEPTQPLQIGLHDNVNDTFVPLADNDMIPLILGPCGIEMAVLSLRAKGVDPRTPSPAITVTVGGLPMADELSGAPFDMVADGSGYVLFDVNAAFQFLPCCFNCSLGLVEAMLQDRSGRQFAGQVIVQLSRNGACPDSSVCCTDVNACQDPNLTQVCP